MASKPLDQVTSVKVKLGILVAASVLVATLVGALGSVGDVPLWLSIPVTVALALGVTQLLAVGMTSPLREMTAAARRMARGDYSGRVAATSNDEVGELARAFNRMAEDLGTVDRQRRELIASVSHELRTPLAGLRAVLENIVDGVAGPDPVALRTALSQAERLSALVSDLLDLARVDAGAVTLATSRVQVRELLDLCVAEARATGRDVLYDVEVRPADLTVDADPQRLHQLVANLLDNASRHSPTAGVVVVAATDQGAGWRLEVVDEGPGIPAVDRDRVFERFGTLGDNEQTGGGTGLGLAIARWVTDLHGGTIRFIDPESGSVGARVCVDVPHHPRQIERPVMTQPTQPPAAPNAYYPAPRERVGPQEPAMDALFGAFWPERTVTGSARAVLAAVAVGVLAGLVLPFRGLGVGTFVVLLACGGAVLATAVHRRTPFTLACSALCVLLAATAVLRDAEWIVILCLLAGALVFIVGLVDGRSVPGFVLAALAWPLSALRGLPWLGRSLRPIGVAGRSGAAVRTAVLSILGVVVFGLLFASADALFKEWADAVVPDLEAGDFVLRFFVAAFVTGVVLGAAYLALNPPRVETESGPSRPVAQRYEWLVPVLLVDAVFAVFLLAQATVIFGGHDYLERTTGLTYAAYVHQGFGQLTVATALTLLVVWAAARKAPRATSSDVLWVRGSLGLLCVLTLVVVASALYRMHVYQEAYGFTQLRLLVDVFEGWLGLLVLAVMVAGLGLRGAWLPRAALLTGAGALLGLALINPDAWITERNLDRYEATGRIDWFYIQGLSADIVPALEGQPADVVDCALMGQTAIDDDWLEFNLSRHRADSLIHENVEGRGIDEPACLSSD